MRNDPNTWPQTFLIRDETWQKMKDDDFHELVEIMRDPGSMVFIDRDEFKNEIRISYYTPDSPHYRFIKDLVEVQ